MVVIDDTSLRDCCYVGVKHCLKQFQSYEES